MYECKICGKQYENRYAYIGHCSAHKRAPGKELKEQKKPELKVDEQWKQENGLYKCPECGVEKPKHGICSHILLKHTEKGKKRRSGIEGFNQKGRNAWNKGLTKETDERVKKHGISISKSQMGKKGREVSKETREKLSIIMSLKNQEKGNSGYKFIKWYKVQNILGMEYNLRGSYELKVASFLNEKKLLWNREKKLSYFDGEITRTYLPDFYLPERNVYIETKGYFSEKDKHKMKLVLEQNNITLIFIFEKDLKNLENILIKD